MPDTSQHLDALNPGQRAAAEYGTAALPLQLPGPLLIIAGAGTGKTTTLAHRVAHLMVQFREDAAAQRALRAMVDRVEDVEAATVLLSELHRCGWWRLPPEHDKRPPLVEGDEPEWSVEA